MNSYYCAVTVDLSLAYSDKLSSHMQHGTINVRAFLYQSILYGSLPYWHQYLLWDIEVKCFSLWLCVFISDGTFSSFYCDTIKQEFLMEKIMHWSAGFTFELW